MTNVLEFIALSFVFVAVFLTSFVLLHLYLQARLERKEAEKEMSEYERIRAKSPIGNIKPLLEVIVKFNKRNRFFTSIIKKNWDKWNKLLTNAGSPGNLTPEDFFALKQLVPMVTFLLLLLLGIRHFVLYPILLITAYFLPDIWINDYKKRWQKDIAYVLPEALDTLTLMVEAGLDFGGAIEIYIQQNRRNPFIEELLILQNEIKLGKSRAEALQRMSSRINYASFSNFTAAVIQAEKTGVSLATTLQNQAHDLRERRFQLAEEMGHKAPVKMMFPMILLIFPIIFIVLFAPVALKYLAKW